jgi:hypothetical protein
MWVRIVKYELLIAQDFCVYVKSYKVCKVHFIVWNSAGVVVLLLLLLCALLLKTKMLRAVSWLFVLK